MRRLDPTAALAALALLCAGAHADDIPVASAADIDNANPQPGDTLVMADGVWTDQHIRLTFSGTAQSPVTLRPQTPGGARLTGSSTIEIGGDHLVVDGLWFDAGTPLGTSHVVRFRSGSTDANNSVLRNTAITGYNPPDRDTRYFWVSLYGSGNTVEHCLFEDHDHSGVTVVVWGDWPNNHVIRHNHFKDRPVGPENGWETIRLGTSEVSTLPSRTVVESNLFTRADGEIEAISDKTGENIHRYNTFVETRATITLRHAFDAQVHGNFFLGNNVQGTGGVRVVGPGHLVWNNYFQDLAGRADAIIALEAGEPDGPLNGYEPVVGGVVAHNTFVNCGDPAFALNRSASSERSAAPAGVLIYGNLISSPGQAVATNVNNGLIWSSNAAFAPSRGTAPSSGLTMLGADPLALDPDGLHRPAAGGPADGLAGNGPLGGFVTDDMDGQPRAAPFDIGADQIDQSPAARRPLTDADVGPPWWPIGSVPPPDVNPALAVVIEAEAFDRLLDPDSDGDVFFVSNTPDASGGAVLKSPGGGRTDLGSEPQETIAAYTIAPPSAGTYTAYYKARGFSSSTDSFFAPGATDTDPDINESTTRTGAFRWETGADLALPGPGETAELRIGRREQDTEIDVIVLYPADDLDTEQLDFLAANPPGPPCAADLDGSGTADFLDAAAFLGRVAADDPRADLSGDDEIDEFDVARFLPILADGCE